MEAELEGTDTDIDVLEELVVKAEVLGMKVIEDCIWGKEAREYNGVEDTAVFVDVLEP